MVHVQKLFFYRATPCVSAVFAVGWCPSVCLSCPPRSCTVLYPDGWRYHQTSFSAWFPGSLMILVFDPQALIPNSRRTHSSGVQNTQGRLRLTEIAVYLGYSRKQARSCHGTLTGSHRWQIDTCRFWWPWVTPNPGFKVTVHLQVEYLKNGRIKDKLTIWKPYAIYRMAPLSITLIDPWPGFQGRDIFQHWISQKRHEIET